MPSLVHLHTMAKGAGDQWPTGPKLLMSGSLLEHIQQLFTKTTLKTYLHRNILESQP